MLAGPGIRGLRFWMVGFILMVWLLAERPLRAGDWPQILGPDRDGQATGEHLAAEWPSSGPRTIWQVPVGSGFAGPAVVGNHLFVFHRKGDSERLEMRSVETGDVIWRRDFSASYRGGINPDNGPRCVPTIHGDHAYVLGAAGDLHCVAVNDGSEVWSRDTMQDFNAPEGYFGVGSTPIVLGERLLVNVGGTDQSGVVAFGLKDGKTLWTATDERPSYAAPSAARIDGKLFGIFVTRYSALAIEPGSGKTRFVIPFGRRGPTVNAATPLVFDNRLFVSSSYGIGCLLTRIDGVRPEVVWANDETLSSQYNTAVYSDGFLYGIHGREDGPPAELRCVEAATGHVRWNETGFGVAHLLQAGDKLLILTIDGRLVLARATPRKFERLAEYRLSRETTRALPALANGRFYCRTNGSGTGKLICLQLPR